MHRLKLLALSAVLALALQLPVPALAQAGGEEAAWAFEESDLPLDKDYLFGRLDNGMRYVVRHNATPAGTGMVQLFIDAGSLSERDNERGYAHFVEHMAFNGSANVPEGEMIKLLEREGLAFGADTNASTDFEQTIYKLDLPRNDETLLDTALFLMRETASHLTFDDAAVDREKGVVLSERRVRDSYAFRNLLDGWEFLYPDAHFRQRLAIGTIESLQQATGDSLRGFWERNYVPQNATLIVVGDFDPKQVEARIVARFSDWNGPEAPAVPDAGPVAADDPGRTDIHIDTALSEQVTIARNGPAIDRPDTVANRQQNVLRQIGYGIVNRRMARLARGENPPYRSAGLGNSEVFDTARTTNLVVNAGDGEWREGLLAAAREYRRALEFGFTEAEVSEQVASLRNAIENAAAGAATRPNRTFVNATILLLTEGQVPTTPESGLERFEDMVPLITPANVMAAIEDELLPLTDPLIRFEGRTAPKGGAEALRAAWAEAMAEPLVAEEAGELAEFAYTDFGPPGFVQSYLIEPEFGIHMLHFANGLRLNLKPTDLQQDRISVRLNVDGGQMLNSKDNPLATGMVDSLPVGGLGKHSYDELQTILAGRSVGMGISADDESFVLGATTTPRDLELQLQLMTATLTDPGYRPQGEVQYRRNVANFFARLTATPNAALGNALGGILSDDDPRFTLRPKEDYDALSFARLREDISDRLARGALELALVGDFDPEQAIALVARTLGALPAREAAFRPYDDNRQRSFTADRSLRVLHHDGEADQALLRLTWPTTDDSEPLESIRLGLLGEVAQLLLTDTLREKLGQTYSPSVSASQSRTYPGWGLFTLVAAVDTADVEASRAAMLDVIEQLRSTPVDADVLLRARRPVLERYENRLKTNGGWMALVDRAQSEPEQLERFASARERIGAVTAEELQALAQQYLDPAKVLEIRVLPNENR